MVKLSISNEEWPEKPLSGEWGSSTFETKDVNLDEFKALLGTGHIWSPILWENNKRSSANAREISAIGFDFDTPTKDWKKYSDEILKKFNLSINIYHTTYNHTEEKPRFRLIALLQKPITPEQYQEYIKLLSTEVPDIDKNCLDLARVFGGTNTELPNQVVNITNYTLNTVEVLQSKLEVQVQREITEKISVRKNRNLLKELKKSGQAYQSSLDDGYKTLKKVKNFNWKSFSLQCQIWKKIEEKTVHLSYRELLILGTNLSYIQGGINRLLTHMNFVSEDEYEKLKKYRCCW